MVREVLYYKCKTRFAPMLLHNNGIAAVEFYKQAFGAMELHRYANPDGSIHVTELSIGGAVFHLREENAARGHFSPGTVGGVTTLIELWVADPAAVAARAVAAGARELNPVKDHAETGYREGSVVDPFGHHWLIIRPLRED
jgi:PhnB protein